MNFKNLIFSEEARSIFGKKEQEIIKKQLNGEKLSQAQRNVLSRSIRKKLEFISKISDFKDEFELKNNSDNIKKIEKTVNIILSDELEKNVRAILLFGSFADKTNIWRSDIDICVVLNKEISVRDATLFRLRVLREISEKIDFQVFNILPLKIKKSIALNHKVLFKKKGFEDLDFSIKYLKEQDYFIRMERIFGVKV